MSAADLLEYHNMLRGIMGRPNRPINQELLSGVEWDTNRAMNKLWESFTGRSVSGSEMMLRELRVPQNWVMALLPIVTEREAIEKHGARIKADTIYTQNWVFDTRVLPQKSRRHLGDLEQVKESTHREYFSGAGTGFEMPLNFAEDPTKVRTYFKKLQQINSSIQLTWTWRIMWSVMQRAVLQYAANLNERLPMTKPEFERALTVVSSSTFALHKASGGGTGAAGLLSALMERWRSTRDIDEDPDVVIVPHAALRNLTLREDSRRSMLNANKNDEEAARLSLLDRYADGRRTTLYGLMAFESMLFPVANTEGADPMATRVTVSQFFSSLGHRDDLRQYGSHMRDIFIADGPKREWTRIGLMDQIDNCGVWDTGGSRSITHLGQQVLAKLAGDGDGVPTMLQLYDGKSALCGAAIAAIDRLTEQDRAALETLAAEPVSVEAEKTGQTKKPRRIRQRIRAAAKPLASAAEQQPPRAAPRRPSVATIAAALFTEIKHDMQHEAVPIKFGGGQKFVPSHAKGDERSAQLLYSTQDAPRTYGDVQRDPYWTLATLFHSGSARDTLEKKAVDLFGGGPFETMFNEAIAIRGRDDLSTTAKNDAYAALADSIVEEEQKHAEGEDSALKKLDAVFLKATHGRTMSANTVQSVIEALRTVLRDAPKSERANGIREALRGEPEPAASTASARHFILTQQNALDAQSGGRRGAKRRRDVSDGSDLLARLHPTYDVVVKLVHLDVPLPFGFILFRNNIRVRAGALLLMRTGEQTGFAAIKNAEVLITQDNATDTLSVHSNFEMAVSIKNPRNLEVVPGVWSSSYDGGAGVRFCKHEATMSDGDIVCVMTQYKDDLHWFVDMSGKPDRRIYASEAANHLDYCTADQYSAQYNWRADVALEHMFSIFALTEPERSRKTLCLQACQYEWAIGGKPGEGAHTHQRPGFDAIGSHERADVYKWLDGNGTSSVEFDGRGMSGMIAYQPDVRGGGMQ